ncbi:MAG: hypothetical protein AMJ56_07645 [Anaerolineae bacterium SG8_19]|nr:MAG: hypothetical protein AMJ56_07645 [Anaerolineae bacterium SG8_19]
MFLPGVNYIFAVLIVAGCLLLAVVFGFFFAALFFGIARNIIPKTKTWKILSSGARNADHWWLHDWLWFRIGAVAGFFLAVYILSGPAYYVVNNLIKM